MSNIYKLSQDLVDTAGKVLRGETIEETRKKEEEHHLGTYGATKVHKSKTHTTISHNGNMGDGEDDVAHGFDAMHHAGAYKQIRSKGVASGSPDYSFSLTVHNKHYDALKSARKPKNPHPGGYVEEEQIDDGLELSEGGKIGHPESLQNKLNQHSRASAKKADHHYDQAIEHDYRHRVKKFEAKSPHHTIMNAAYLREKAIHHRAMGAHHSKLFKIHDDHAHNVLDAGSHDELHKILQKHSARLKAHAFSSKKG